MTGIRHGHKGEQPAPGDAPFTFVVNEQGKRLEIQRAKRKGMRVYLIPAKGCTTEQGLYKTLARVLSFPAYFGMNWDALYDCLRDVSGSSGIGTLIVFEESDYLLQLSKKELRTLLKIFEAATEEQGFRLPFRVLFVGPENLRSEFTSRTSKNQN